MDSVYAELGIHRARLGCVKLVVSSAPITVQDVGGESALYTSSSPHRPWVRGYINQHRAHVTLIYGLLDVGDRAISRAHVDTALAGWVPPASVRIADIAVFPSPVPDEDPYTCIVAKLDLASLKKAHDALLALPNVTRFPEFKAHVTLAYVRSEACTEELLEALRKKLNGSTLPVEELVYEPAGTVI